MPILSYFTVVGSTRVALLMLADVTLEKSTRPAKQRIRCGFASAMAPEVENTQGVFEAEKKFDSARGRGNLS